MAWIMTHDEARRTRWIKLFGVERLPVKVAKPRWQHHPFSAAMVYAYDLDARRLHPQARARFAAYIASRAHVDYGTAGHMVDGWPVQAAGCELAQEETVVSMETAVLSFRGVFAREQSGAVAYA